jgi:hypothetical protein
MASISVRPSGSPGRRGLNGGTWCASDRFHGSSHTEVDVCSNFVKQIEPIIWIDGSVTEDLRFKFFQTQRHDQRRPATRVLFICALTNGAFLGREELDRPFRSLTHPAFATCGINQKLVDALSPEAISSATP